MARCGNGWFAEPGRQVEPLLLAVAQAGKSDPAQHPRFIAANLKDRIGRRAIEEVNAALPPLTLQIEPAHSVARQPGQIVVVPRRRPARLDVEVLQRGAVGRVDEVAHGAEALALGQQRPQGPLAAEVREDLPVPALLIDGLGEETSKEYLHHYNFPPFSVGEVRPMRSPGRREIGHGALAERALKAVLPPKDQFPYVIRVVSECVTSNGSTSMASTCGSTLALMDAGVPIKAPVAGAAMGLVLEGEGRFAIRVEKDDLDLAAVAGVDQSRCVDDGDPVARCEPGAGLDESCITVGNRHCEARRNDCTLARPEPP